jgi:glutathione synthase/RimK-type ligase-like ATP-grasp enzyme
VSLFFGIAREPIYSPGKVEHDRAILEEVAQRLRARHAVRVLDVAAARRERERPDLVFAMCQGAGGLALLRGWEEAGIRVVNSAASIAACRRENMLEAFDTHRVRYPESLSLRLDHGVEPPEWSEGGVWLKRGDVHAVEPADVVFCRDREEVRGALDGFRRRGIASAIVQRHVRGEVIKLYAAPHGFLRCYRSGEQVAAGWVESVGALARRGAAAVGVEVFGGDVVREPDGTLWLIDLNDWPSYAPCRSDAAAAIVDFLDGQGRVSRS